jgi:hypothetical protein
MMDGEHMIYLENASANPLIQRAFGSVTQSKRKSKPSIPGDAFRDLVERGFIQPKLGMTLLAISKLLNSTGQVEDVHVTGMLADSRRSLFSRLRQRLEPEVIEDESFPSLNRCCAVTASIYLDFIFLRISPPRGSTTLAQTLRTAIIRSASELGWPQMLELLLWILFVGSLSGADLDTELWFRRRLRGATSRLKFSRFSWADMKITLKKALWVDQLHEEEAKQLFMHVMGRA